MKLYRKKNMFWITCNSPGTMKLSSHQKISPHSVSIQWTGVSGLSKWLPAIISPMVRTIWHGMALLIMIGWPHLICEPSMIPPCHLGIQKLHIHWRCPSGSGIYSHTVRHFPATSPSAAKWSTVMSSEGYVNHVITIMTHPSFTKFWNFYCPRTIHFS